MTAMKQYHESKISERVVELCECMGDRSSDGSPIDFSEHLRYVNTLVDITKDPVH